MWYNYPTKRGVIYATDSSNQRFERYNCNFSFMS